MRKLTLVLAAGASLLGAALAGGAQAAPQPQLIFGPDRASDMPTLEKVQYFWGGRNYCWYDGGWRGPGYYWCGYAWRRGFGWGGGYGWNGWARPGFGPRPGPRPGFGPRRAFAPRGGGPRGGGPRGRGHR